jgi:hypothetical protein
MCTRKGSAVVVIGVRRSSVGCDNGPRRRLLTTEITNAVGSSSVELFRIHNYRKPQQLGLRFRLVLTEEHTKRLELQTS